MDAVVHLGTISTSPNVHHGRHALETVEEVVLLRVTGRGCVIFFLWTEGLTEAFREFFADIKTAHCALASGHCTAMLSIQYTMCVCTDNNKTAVYKTIA